MIVKCVIACINANGESDFAFVKVACTQEQYDDGEHYETVKEWAFDNDYEEPFVVFDENDPPKFLFEHFVWESATVIMLDMFEKESSDNEHIPDD